MKGKALRKQTDIRVRFFFLKNVRGFGILGLASKDTRKHAPFLKQFLLQPIDKTVNFGKAYLLMCVVKLMNMTRVKKKHGHFIQSC